jgi:hypothetical protein
VISPALLARGRVSNRWPLSCLLRSAISDSAPMPVTAKIGSGGPLTAETLQMIHDDWLPKSVQCLKDYNARKFAADVVAGVTVGLVALPLAMAFAIASGVPPQAGLYTAIIAGFLISALGGSTTQIGGPTGAFVVVVYGIVARHGLDGLYMCTLMAGVLLVILGITGLGTAVKYIPRPVVVGFTNGIAVISPAPKSRISSGSKLTKFPENSWRAWKFSRGISAHYRRLKQVSACWPSRSSLSLRAT